VKFTWIATFGIFLLSSSNYSGYQILKHLGWRCLMPVERKKELRRRRQRKKKLKKLKMQLASAKNAQERERLIRLIKRRQPYFDPDKE
jgi:hypothetical protein